MAVTVYHGSQAKPFTWSYSRLKNFEACPKKHFEVDIQKSIKEDDSDQLQWGDAVHKAMEARCGEKRTPLPDSMKDYEKWAERIVTPGGNIYVEQKLALTKDFAFCGYFERGVWFRAKGDLIKVVDDVALVIDWKTGKILEDSVQLALTAACVFAKFPEVKKLRSKFIWLQHDAETVEDFTPADMPGMWQSIWPRIKALEHAHNTTSYQAKPGRLCRSWCPVRSCPYYGESH
jgi:hypothetical protein